jgi:uncharacterized repeat protein (TIGR02543 family)
MKDFIPMKSKKIILSMGAVLFMYIASAQVSITIDVAIAGGLRSALIAAGGNKSTTTNLTVTGYIDARDVKFMRDSMPVLAVLDIENVQIKAYNGTGGTSTTSTTYPANTMPQESFSTTNFSPIDGMQGNPILKTVILPSSLKVIGSYAFSLCRGLTHLPQIPNQVTTIETQAFCSCYGVSGGLSIPNLVTTIGDNAFQSCRGLTGNLILPKGLTTLGYGAFDGCKFTGILKIPEGIINILEWTFQGNNFTGIIFPNNLKSIKYDAFASDTTFCGNLILPGSLTTITYGFRGCRGFTACYIPSSVTLITTNNMIGGFTGNKDFKKIVINKTTPLAINNLTFDGVDKNTCELIVPAGSKAAYQTADGWKDFNIITEAIFVTLNTLGGNPSAPITTTTANTTITTPDIPVRDGYSFVAWYKEAACTNAWDFASDIVTAPVTLYAKWTLNPVNITGREISGFTLYPNPATTKINLGYLPQSAQISIFNIDGKLMKQQNTTTSESAINIEGLLKGVYFVKVKNKEINMVQKFIKQ